MYILTEESVGRIKIVQEKVRPVLGTFSFLNSSCAITSTSLVNSLRKILFDLVETVVP